MTCTEVECHLPWAFLRTVAGRASTALLPFAALHDLYLVLLALPSTDGYGLKRCRCVFCVFDGEKDGDAGNADDVASSLIQSERDECAELTSQDTTTLDGAAHRLASSGREALHAHRSPRLDLAAHSIYEGKSSFHSLILICLQLLLLLRFLLSASGSGVPDALMYCLGSRLADDPRKPGFSLLYPSLHMHMHVRFCGAGRR